VLADCAIYDAGRRREGEPSLHDARAAAGEPGSFAWIGLREPAHSELEDVAAEFGLHELAIEDAVDAHQRPKLEAFGETLLLVLKPVRYIDSDEVVEVDDVLVVINPNFLITVRHGSACPLDEVRATAQERPELLALGPWAAVHAIVDRVVDDYDNVSDGVDGDVQEVEEQVFAAERGNPTRRIYKLEREVLQFQRAVAPLVGILERLVGGRVDHVPDELHPYFRDVLDHAVRTRGRIDGLRELLSSALQADLTQVTVRQNEDMRKISAWVAIAAVPTMLAGIYGMNFDHMPELRWTYGYPLVLAVMLAVCGLLYRRFRRVGWL